MEKMDDSKSADESIYDSDNTSEAESGENEDYSFNLKGRKKHTKKKRLSPDCNSTLKI